MADNTNTLFKLVQRVTTATDTQTTAQMAGQSEKTGNIGQETPPIIAEPGDGEGGGKVIDVIQNMQFTSGIITPALKERIPFVKLDEFTQNANAILAQATYFTRGLGFTSSDLAKVGGLVEKGRDKVASGMKDLVSSFASNANDRIKNLITQAGDRATDQIGNLGSVFSTNEDAELKGPLLPYNGLYVRSPLIRTYFFPYFNDAKRSITNGMSDTQTGFASKSMFNTGVKKYADQLQDLAEQLLAAAPGAYVEKFKSFSPAETANSFKIDFELINTIDPKKIQTHFDFIFLILYQNLPFRKNMAEILPPKLYALTVPGEVYYPFCNISQIKIDCIGVKRMFNIVHPINGDTVKASVPEVYSISITVTPLTYDAANFMVADQIFKARSS